MEKTYEIPEYGMLVTVTPGVGHPPTLGGNISSNLHAVDDEAYDSAIDGLEALILGHACEGIDITAPAYVKGIQTAVDTIANNA